MHSPDRKGSREEGRGRGHYTACLSRLSTDDKPKEVSHPHEFGSEKAQLCGRHRKNTTGRAQGYEPQRQGAATKAPLSLKSTEQGACRFPPYPDTESGARAASAQGRSQPRGPGDGLLRPHILTDSRDVAQAGCFSTETGILPHGVPGRWLPQPRRHRAPSPRMLNPPTSAAAAVVQAGAPTEDTRSLVPGRLLKRSRSAPTRPTRTRAALGCAAPPLSPANQQRHPRGPQGGRLPYACAGRMRRPKRAPTASVRFFCHSEGGGGIPQATPPHPSRELEPWSRCAGAVAWRLAAVSPRRLLREVCSSERPVAPPLALGTTSPNLSAGRSRPALGGGGAGARRSLWGNWPFGVLLHHSSEPLMRPRSSFELSECRRCSSKKQGWAPLHVAVKPAAVLGLFLPVELHGPLEDRLL